ncbi:MAG: hypothetical protein IPL46_25690 [Saprospiraceae bacterium]|nr:hypothetical protein [Saprospiraceae bacterium]
MDKDGDFVVVWQSSEQDGNSAGVFGQRFNSIGVGHAFEFQANTFTTGAQAEASVAMDETGEFEVVWHSFAQDGSLEAVMARRFNADAQAQGAELRVNSFTTSSQFVPAIAMDADGDFVVAWQSNLQDGSQTGIYSQRYGGKVHPCAGSDLNLSGSVFNALTIHTQGMITSTQLIIGSTTYQSALSILMPPDFQVSQGAVFQASIDDCGL